MQLSTWGHRLAVRAKTPAATLRLEEFVPFRLNRLAAAVSDHLAGVYRESFGLEIPEWRVLVTVAQHRDCTAQTIVASTRMHKSRVSRAVAALTRRALIEGASSARDGREVRLHLTRAGRRLYVQLVPRALERERALLACLDARERRVLGAALGRLERELGLGGA